MPQLAQWIAIALSSALMFLSKPLWAAQSGLDLCGPLTSFGKSPQDLAHTQAPSAFLRLGSPNNDGFFTDLEVTDPTLAAEWTLDETLIQDPLRLATQSALLKWLFTLAQQEGLPVSVRRGPEPLIYLDWFLDEQGLRSGRLSHAPRASYQPNLVEHNRTEVRILQAPEDLLVLTAVTTQRELQGDRALWPSTNSHSLHARIRMNESGSIRIVYAYDKDEWWQTKDPLIPHHQILLFILNGLQQNAD